MAKSLPHQDQLNSILEYRPETGDLFWKMRTPEMFDGSKEPAWVSAKRWNSKNAGNPVSFCVGPNGHLYTSIWKQKSYAHRIIWKLVHGVDAEDIDHINGNPADNRLENLRSVTHQENGRNMKRKKNNTSGVVGVQYDPRRQKWYARIMVGYRTIHLGVFDNFDDAVRSRKIAETKYGFHPNHGRVAA